MSEVETVLETEARDMRGSAAARRLRREGRIPAVLYGHKEATVNISLPERELSHVIRAGVQMLDIKVGGKAEKALIKELQYDPVSLELLHVDLARIAMDETVTVGVPVETSGTPKGASEDGVLDIVMKELEVECLPADIPAEIKIKVTEMEIGDSVLVQDLDLPEGVKPAEGVDAEATVITIHEPRKGLEEEEEEAEEGEEAAAAEPEVIGEKDREEKTEEAEEGGKAEEGEK